MTNLFENFETDLVEKVYSLETNGYLCTIKAAYITEPVDAQGSKTGSMGLVLETETDTGFTRTETFWIQSKKTKSNYFINSKTGAKEPLAGFTQANNLCKVALGKPIMEAKTGTKVFEVYDSTAGKAIPQEKLAIIDLIGKQVYATVILQEENKTAKNKTTGVYEPIADTRTVNVTHNFFNAKNKKNANELEQELDATAYDKWVAKNRGVTKNKVKAIAPTEIQSFETETTQEVDDLFSEVQPSSTEEVNTLPIQNQVVDSLITASADDLFTQC